MDNTQRQRRKFGLTFGLFLMGLGVVVLYLASHTITDLASALQSTSWSTAPGRVTLSEVTKLKSTDAKSRTTAVTWHATIEYRYTVGGQAYDGDQIWFGQYKSSNDDVAREAVQAYPEGRKITVYHDPDEPHSAVLQSGVFPSTWVLPGFGLLFAVAGTWLLFCWWKMRS